MILIVYPVVGQPKRVGNFHFIPLKGFLISTNYTHRDVFSTPTNRVETETVELSPPVNLACRLVEPSPLTIRGQNRTISMNMLNNVR